MTHLSLMGRLSLCWCLLTQLACAQQPIAAADRSELLLIVGAAGKDEYAAAFGLWADRWRQAAEQAGALVTVIGRAESTADSGSTPDRDAVLAAVARSAGIKTTAPLWLVFIGHGTFDQRDARLNLRGPDLSAGELAEACRPLQRPLAAVICGSCSAPFLNALSGPDRCIITATKDGNQLQYSRFGEYMSAAIAGLEGDIDRDGQTSLLDDNGDQQGVRSEIFNGLKPNTQIKADKPIDGRRAAELCLVLSPQERQLTAAQRKERDQLETELNQLKLQKEQLSETDYLQQLETILLKLARLYQAAEQAAATQP